MEEIDLGHGRRIVEAEIYRQGDKGTRTFFSSELVPLQFVIQDRPKSAGAAWQETFVLKGEKDGRLQYERVGNPVQATSILGRQS